MYSILAITPMTDLCAALQASSTTDCYSGKLPQIARLGVNQRYEASYLSGFDWRMNNSYCPLAARVPKAIIDFE
jgi:hypothetical protein